MLMVRYAEQKGIAWGYSPAAESIAEIADVLATGEEVSRLQYVRVMLHAWQASDELFDLVCPDTIDMQALLLALHARSGASHPFESFVSQSAAEEA